jgi:excisionase family DNA binding protein
VPTILQDVPDELSDSPVMTVADVARFLQIEENTVRALARRGELPAKKLGKHWRFLRDEVLASLHPDPPTTPSRPSGEDYTASAISQEDAAELLGVSVRTVRRMLAAGRIETVRSPTGARKLSRQSVVAAASRLYGDPGGSTSAPNDA